MASIEEDDTNKDKKLTEPVQQHKPASLQAQFVTTVNRDTGASSTAANIDKIIEEEDEDEDEEEEEDNNNYIIKSPIISPKKSHDDQKPTIIEIQGETTKFTLESVVLELDDKPKISQDLVSESDKYSFQSVNEFNSQQENNDVVEVAEIKVEEGYATRQMDQYFRETIAKIKEELTKKLDKNDNLEHVKHKHHGHHGHSHDPDDIGEFSGEDFESDDEDFDSEYDQDDDLPTDLECNCQNCNEKNLNSKQQQSTNCKHLNNRNLLHQYFLNTKNKKPQKNELIASYLVVIGCIINQFIIDGLCFNYANLFEIVQKNFKNSSRLVSSMPAMGLIVFYLLFAPFSVFLTKRFGARSVSISGTLISTLSLFICSFTYEIIGFTIFYGVFTGEFQSFLIFLLKSRLSMYSENT